MRQREETRKTRKVVGMDGGGGGEGERETQATDGGITVEMKEGRERWRK